MDRRPGCYMRLRDGIRKCVKENKSLLRDMTALIAQLTVISMIVSCGVDWYTAIRSVRCLEISVEFPDGCIFSLGFTGLMVLALVVCKFMEHGEKPVRVSRMIALGLYIWGIFIFTVTWDRFTDKLCEYVEHEEVKLLPPHLYCRWPRQAVPVEINDLTERLTVLVPKCTKSILVDKDCGRQYLRVERNVLFFFCAVSYCILSVICCWYFIYMTERSMAVEARLSGRDSGDHNPNLGEEELIEMQEEAGANPPAAEIAVATIENEGQPGPNVPELSRPGCSTGPSNAEDGFEEIDLRKLASWDKKTGECTYCHALNRPQTEGDTPKFCQSCGSQFSK